jgi:hypothetical protein
MRATRRQLQQQAAQGSCQMVAPSSVGEAKPRATASRRLRRIQAPGEIGALPSEVLATIGSLLLPKDLAAARLVCRYWALHLFEGRSGLGCLALTVLSLSASLMRSTDHHDPAESRKRILQQAPSPSIQTAENAAAESLRGHLWQAIPGEKIGE